MSSKRIFIVFCTAPNPETAKSLAEHILSAKAAACVNILSGVRSLYHWEGALEDSSEVLLTIKTTEECYPDLEELISEKHPYKTPEILAIPAARALESYAAWVAEEVRVSETSR